MPDSEWKPTDYTNKQIKDVANIVGKVERPERSTASTSYKSYEGRFQDRAGDQGTPRSPHTLS
jgi:hypothetical protein